MESQIASGTLPRKGRNVLRPYEDRSREAARQGGPPCKGKAALVERVAVVIEGWVLMNREEI